MRILALADIHANLAALEAVLSHAEGAYDELVSLGDLVGYGPDPNECVEMVRKLASFVIGGNHDDAAGKIISLRNFSRQAEKAMNWTMRELTQENIEYLSSLEPIGRYRDLLLCHGSPDGPLWEYINSEGGAKAAFESTDFSICLFGHTHYPTYSYEFLGEEQRRIRISKKVTIESYEMGYGTADLTLDYGIPNSRILLNPGSVGFPRDGEAHKRKKYLEAKARYGILDMDAKTWTFKRVEYDLSETAKKMNLARLGGYLD